MGSEIDESPSDSRVTYVACSTLHATGYTRTRELKEGLPARNVVLSKTTVPATSELTNVREQRLRTEKEMTRDAPDLRVEH